MKCRYCDNEAGEYPTCEDLNCINAYNDYILEEAGGQ